MTRILGVDPGSRHTGYGIIDVDRGQLKWVASGRISPAGEALALRLLNIDAGLTQLLAEHRPDEAAFEQVFVSVNVRSALILGHARGAALCAVARQGLPIAEYAPAQIKQALTGSGRADKLQIQHMVRILLKTDAPLSADAADALAVALTHAQVRSSRLPPVLAAARSRRRWKSL